MAIKDWKGWMILTIIFAALFIIETILIITAYNLGSEVLRQDAECYDICSNKYAEYPVNSTLIYDVSQDECTCYIDGEIIHTENLDD